MSRDQKPGRARLVGNRPPKPADAAPGAPSNALGDQPVNAAQSTVDNVWGLPLLLLAALFLLASLVAGLLVAGLPWLG
jgi:hypothetical protein